MEPSLHASSPQLELQHLAARLARQRGVAPFPTPELVELPRAELVTEALASAARDAPAGFDELRRELARRLLLVPPHFDWSRALARVLERELLAFYDAEQNRIFSDSRLAGRVRTHTFAHELGHALQAHHFGLRWNTDGWDRRAALHALAEADAEALARELLGNDTAPLPVTGVTESGTRDAFTIPGLLERALIAPYADGHARIELARTRDGWAGVNALLREPPDSTHELLHPELQPELVSPLPAAPPPASGGALTHDETLGEQTLRIVVEEWLPRTVSEQLASHWRGDRFSIFAAGPLVASLWQLNFDSAAAAQDVARTFTRGLELAVSAGGHGTASAATRWRCWPHPDGGSIALAAASGHAVAFLSLRGTGATGCEALRAWGQAVTSSDFGTGNPGQR